MEDEYGRFFLANYQCAPPMWFVGRARDEDPAFGAVRDGTGVNGAGLGTWRRRPSSRSQSPTGAGGASAAASAPSTPPTAARRPRMPSQAACSSPGAAFCRAEAAAGGVTAKRGSAPVSLSLGQPPSPVVLQADTPLAARGRLRGPSSESDSRLASLPGTVPLGGRPLKEVDAEVEFCLDRFFAEDVCWQQVLREVSSAEALRSRAASSGGPAPGRKTSFRVQVPKPYPGVWYRKTKDLNGHYPRYAKHGSIVVGEVEEDREWVRVRGGSLYLPLRIGPVQILEPLPQPVAEVKEVAGAADVAEVKEVAGAADVAMSEGNPAAMGPKAQLPQTSESLAQGQRCCPCGVPSGSPVPDAAHLPREGAVQREAAISFFSR